MRLIHRLVALFSLFLVLGAVGLARAADLTVTISATTGTVFTPANLTITVGDRVDWRNRQALQHTATSGVCNAVSCTPDGIWDTGILNPNTTSAFVTFNTPGTFPYYCQFHGTMGMVGTITVQAPVPVQSKTWGAIKALFRMYQP